MPTIAQAIASNRQRLASGNQMSPDINIPIQQNFSIPPIGAPSGLPSRGAFSSNLIVGSDFYAGAQQFRFGQRSSAPPSALSVSKSSTPQSLLNKKLISPTIGGGSRLQRYNVVNTFITATLVTSGASATQSFVASGVQAADRLIGYQWASKQAAGVVALGIRVTGNNSIAIDFFNPTAGSLTPTGGVISLFLVQ